MPTESTSSERTPSKLLSTLSPVGLNVEDVSTYLFAADKAAPRRKRPSDVAQFLVMAIGFGLLAWTAENDVPIDDRFLAVAESLPSWIRFFGWIGYTGAAVVLLVLFTVILLRGGIGRGVLRDTLITFLLVVVLASFTSASMDNSQRTCKILICSPALPLRRKNLPNTTSGANIRRPCGG